MYSMRVNFRIAYALASLSYANLEPSNACKSAEIPEFFTTLSHVVVS